MDVVVYDKVGKESDRLATLLLGTYPQEMITDAAIASFDDGADDIPVKALTVGIEPVQSGTGDPSPTNVRPISGWTGANVTRTGVNVWDESAESGDINVGTGAKRSSSSRMRSANFVSVKPGTTYYVHTSKRSSTIVCYYDSTRNYPYTTQGAGWNELTSGSTFTTPSWCHYIMFYWSATAYDNDISVNYPETDTEYHAYTGTTIPITFPTEAGTVYDATMTLNPDRTGTLVVDRAMVDLGTLGYLKSSSIQNGFVATSGMPDDFPLAPNSSAIPNWICSNYGNIVSNNDITLASVDYALAWRVAAQNKGIIVKDSNYTEYYTNNDMVSFKAAMSGVQLVYELAEPQTFQLTADQVSGILTTLYGTNNVWADTGNVSLTYRADLGKYIDSHITTAVANALNA